MLFPVAVAEKSYVTYQTKKFGPILVRLGINNYPPSESVAILCGSSSDSQLVFQAFFSNVNIINVVKAVQL